MSTELMKRFRKLKNTVLRGAPGLKRKIKFYDSQRHH